MLSVAETSEIPRQARNDSENHNSKKPPEGGFLFIFPVIPTVMRRAGRRWRRRRTVFVVPLILFLGRFGGGLDFDQHHVDADLFHVAQVDKQARFAPMEAPATGHNDALHLPFGIGEHDVDHLA